MINISQSLCSLSLEHQEVLQGQKVKAWHSRLTGGYGLCQFWSHKKANVLTPSYFECVKKGLTVNTEWSNICFVTECLVENSYEDMFSLSTIIMSRSYNLWDPSPVFFVWQPCLLLSFCEEFHLSFDACTCLSWKRRWFFSLLFSGGSRQTCLSCKSMCTESTAM